MISPFIAYLAWAAILIVVLVILIKLGYNYFSAITLSVLIALVVLAIIYPYQIENDKYIYRKEDKFFAYIFAISFTIITLFVLYKALLDRNTSSTNEKESNVQTLKIVTEPAIAKENSKC